MLWSSIHDIYMREMFSEHDGGPGGSDAFLCGPLTALDQPPARKQPLEAVPCWRHGKEQRWMLDFCPPGVAQDGSLDPRKSTSSLPLSLAFLIPASPMENVTIDINMGVARTVRVIPQEALPKA